MNKLLKIILLSFGFLLAACEQRFEVGEIRVEPEFMEFYNDFLIDAKKHGLDFDSSPISILYFEDDFVKAYSENENAIAACSLRDHQILISKKEVEKIKDYKNASSEEKKLWIKILIYHELGHCFLNKKHDDSKTIIEGRILPKTLMNSTSPEIWNTFYFKKSDYYFNQLFAE